MAAPSRGGMRVRRIGADGDVDRHGRGRRDRFRTAGWRRRSAGRRCFSRCGRALRRSLPARSAIQRGVHFAAGFFGGAEAAVGEHRFHVFAGVAGDGDFEIVDRGGAVQREGGGVAAAHQIDQDRREAALDDVAAESPQDHFLARARASASASTTARNESAARMCGSESSQRRNAAARIGLGRNARRALCRRGPRSGWSAGRSSSSGSRAVFAHATFPLRSTFSSACAVWLFLKRRICSGVPAATTLPPFSPPSGPRSMIQSADLITSR